MGAELCPVSRGFLQGYRDQSEWIKLSIDPNTKFENVLRSAEIPNLLYRLGVRIRTMQTDNNTLHEAAKNLGPSLNEEIQKQAINKDGGNIQLPLKIGSLIRDSVYRLFGGKITKQQFTIIKNP